MKIILTVASYYPLKDGVQAVTQYLAEGLVSKGHDVTVVTGLVENCPSTEINNGVKIIRFNIYNKFTFHFGNKKEYRKLILNLTKDADALVAVCLQSVVADWLLGILDDIKCGKILHMHGMHDFKWHTHDFYSLAAFSKKIFRDVRWGTFYPVSFKNIRKFDMIIHLHERDNAYKYFEKNRLGKNIVIENAAEDMFFSSSFRPVKEIPQKYMIFVANYDVRKNQALCMETFYRAKTEECSLVFIGSRKNKYYKYLVEYKQKLAKIYGKKEVYLLTDIPRKEIPNYVKNSFCCLMTSTWEAFPISIIEAMACGTPFISTDVGVLNLLPGGVTVKNKGDLKSWIEMLIINPEIAKEMGKIGKIYSSKHLSQQVQIEKLEKILLQTTRQKD